MCNFGRGDYEEHFCDIILNLDQWFRSLFKVISKLALVANILHIMGLFVQFLEEHFYLTNLNLDLWFRRRCV